MRLALLEMIGAYGILLDYKTVLPDFVEIEISDEGFLTVGRRTYSVENGMVRFPEYWLLAGPNKVTFKSKDGVEYACGVIHRNNRFINIINPVDTMIVALCLACEKQGKAIERLENEIKVIKNQYGITII